MAIRSDKSIAGKVDRALWNNDVLRHTDYGEIDILVKTGVVTLRGHVINTTNQQRAEDAARMVPGVIGVESYLVPDDKILLAVAGALRKIEHDYEVKFFTGAHNGVVVLTGYAGSADVRSLAEQLASSVPGVRCVINSIKAPGVVSPSEDNRFLQPAIGQLIYFRDGQFGKVQKVIINPNNRRVVAMILQGRSSDQYQKPTSPGVKGSGSPDHPLVIPISEIRYLTKNSGFLETRSTEAAKYADFDPSHFTPPGEDWMPPYPYSLEDVLFPVETHL